MLGELYGTDCEVFCGICREQIVLCVVGIVGNRYCSVFRDLYGTEIVVCCGNCTEQRVLWVGEF